MGVRRYFMVAVYRYFYGLIKGLVSSYAVRYSVNYVLAQRPERYDILKEEAE
jgi:hypothetical protein